MTSLISYAQNFEDVMLWRALKHVEKGFYLDIGAQDPLVDSVSLAFHERGWEGIHVEPTPHYAQLLREQRQGDTVLEVAVGNAGELLTFFEIPDTGISTADPQIAQQHRERGFETREITVPCVRLSSIFKTCGKQDIHWMKIDVEGFEWSALTSWGKAAARPWIVVVESTLPLTQVESYQRWEPLLLRRGYTPVYFDGLNRYYVSKEKRELIHAFNVPPNVFDGFSVSGTASNTLHHHLKSRHALELGNVEAQVQLASSEIEGLKLALTASDLEHGEQLRERCTQLEAQKDGALQLDQTLRSEISALQSEVARTSGLLIVTKDEFAGVLRATQEVALKSTQALADREQEFSAQAEERAQAYRSELASLQGDVVRTSGLLIAARDEFAVVLQAAQHEALKSAQALAAREQEFSAQAAERARAHRSELASLQAEVARTSGSLIATKDEFAGVLHAAQQETLKSAQTLAAYEKEVDTWRLMQQQDFRKMQSSALTEIARVTHLLGDAKDQYATLQRTVTKELLMAEKSLLESGERTQAEVNRLATRERELGEQLVARADALSTLQRETKQDQITLLLEVATIRANADLLTHAHQQREQALLNEVGAGNETIVQLEHTQARITLELAEQVGQAAKTTAELQQLLYIARQEQTALRSSISWRLTQPFRAFYESLRPRRETRNVAASNESYASANLNYRSASESVLASQTINSNASNFQKVFMFVSDPPPNSLATARHMHTLAELLDLDGAHFIDCAYLTLLKRPSDLSGGTFYLDRLDKGVAKIQILDEIGSSLEGRRSAIENVSDLLSLENEQFIECAYYTLLNRLPDSSGGNFYLDQLAKGVTKIRILSDLHHSAEGRSRRVDLPGLKESLLRHRLLQLPLVGWTIKLFGGLEDGVTVHQRLRISGAQSATNANRTHAEMTRIADACIRTYATLDAQMTAQTTNYGELCERHDKVESLFSELAAAVAQNQRALELFSSAKIEATQAENGSNNPSNASASISTALAASQIGDGYADRLQEFVELSQKVGNLSERCVATPLKCGTRTIYYYVDHTVQCPSNTGVQRVARRMAAAFLAAGERIRFVKWDSTDQVLRLISVAEIEHLAKWSGPTLEPAEKSLYELVDGSAEDLPIHDINSGNWLVVPEVTHITNHREVPTIGIFAAARRMGLRTAFVFYDAIPLRRAEFGDSAGIHAMYMENLLLADLVLPISNWSKADLVSFFTVHDRARAKTLPRIETIFLPGASHLDLRLTVPALASESDHLILSVGTIDQRKNQVALIHAFEAYCAKNPKTDWRLAFAGNLHPAVASEMARSTSSNPNIRYLQPVSDEELSSLYRQCAFTVFPSVEEGFGLPILESLWYAKPCLCANFGAMHEVAQGGGCLEVDTRDEIELLKGIESLIGSAPLRDRLAREAVSRSIGSWSEYVSQFATEMDCVVSPVTRLDPIFYWVDHTSGYPSNSGIQRVVRGLARALIELGIELIPCKWDQSHGKLVCVTDSELDHLALWSGPPSSSWSPWREPSATGGWVLVPELTTYLHDPGVDNLKHFAEKNGLHTAWIFHDAIPWKMRDIYPIEATQAHAKYMMSLGRQDLVLANSEYSCRDLQSFLYLQDARTPSLFERVVPSALPGEYLGSNRITSQRKVSNRQRQMLCVGTVEPRKNYLTVLAAFSKLGAMTTVPIELVIAGNAPFPDLTAALETYIASDPRVRWIRTANDHELKQLYEECDFTVFGSTSEGFGLPILESLWNGRPCVCASFGAMEEVGQGGGCLMVDVRDPQQLSAAMLRLVEDDDLRFTLQRQAISRSFRTWQEYAAEVAYRMAMIKSRPIRSLTPPFDHAELYKNFANLRPRPKLSICITTYNRAAWLDLSLSNLCREWPQPHVDVDFVICDNESSDATPEVMKKYESRSDIRYVRNKKNVGMLGNLRVTANQAEGEYIWILGDDDLLMPGAISRVLKAIAENPDTALVYLNYSYTRVDDAATVASLDIFLNESTPILAPEPDLIGTVREICAKSENFFTAIYCLVFRRDHAIRAYTQNTAGRPFSTLLTCIPTTYYVLNQMMDERAYWVGKPQLVVNLNVSWMKFAPLWILERIPEVYDLAEHLGASRTGVDRWRKNNLPGVIHFLKEIFDDDPEGNAEFFSMVRLMSRIKAVDGFKDFASQIMSIYCNAFERRHPAASIAPEILFAGVLAGQKMGEK